MRIVDFLTHPPFQYNLCRTGHEFFFAPRAIWREWDLAYGPWPGANAHAISGAVPPDEFDLAIATDRYLVEHGVNAFMSDDPSELRRALELLLGSAELAREVRQGGREIVQRHFGIDRFAADWNALFAEVGP